MARSIVGPFRPHVPDGVRFDDLGHAVRLTATTELDGLATGHFSQPGVHASLLVSELDATDLLGFAYTQFAMPVRAGAGRRFDFAPATNLRSPGVVMPLVLRDAACRVCLLAPLDSWHEQVIAVEQDDDGIRELRWGWHGDLDGVPAGFTTTLGCYEGDSVADVFERWGADVRASAGTTRSARHGDQLLTHLSYWTDNGAAYWYRTEAGRSLPDTLVDKVAELDELGVAVRSVELDSWFYPHEVNRPVAEIGYLESVPPTGMLEWTPRTDVLPGGVGEFARRLGGRPLVLHSRHISPSSPYLEGGDWWVDLAAHPVDQRFFDRWFADASSWGATCIEQDWMMVTWFGVRPMRERPGRAVAWQRALDRAAGDHGMTLLWCMATPADLIAAAELSNVLAVRTSDDYRFADDPATLWYWYLTVNRLADALGLATFKDCFFTAVGDGIDGDPHPEVEALLSVMSAGPVGIGDRLGRTDVDLLRRVARPDGVLVTSDRPAVLADPSWFRPAGDDGRLCWATASSGDWTYVIALHTADTTERIADELALEDEALVYDWRSGTASPARSIAVDLGRREWGLFVCCPIEESVEGGRRALIGDPSKYVTMGASRVRRDLDRVELVLAGGEPGGVVRWWSDRDGLFDEWQPHHAADGS